MPNDPSRAGGGRTHGLWARTAPEFKTCRINGSASANVLVIGGGFTGLSTALHLSERGTSVIVIEASDIGFGGSGRNVGLVNAGLWLPPDTVVELLGETRGEQLVRLLSEAPQLVFDIIRRCDISCEAVHNGTLHCAVGLKGREEIERRFSQWHSRGAPVELLSEAECATKAGTAAYAGALLDRRAGTLQPLAYVRGLGRAAVSKGCRIFSGDAVQRMERSGSDWRAVTARGAVSAKWVVVATDVYGTGPWRQIAREQIRLPYFNIATNPLGDVLQNSVLPERQGAWDTQKVLRSFRMDSTGRLIFGSVGALRGTGAPIHRAWVRRTIRALFPQLNAIELEDEWYGTIGMTTDNLPRFHQLASNVVAVSGYNGRGIAPGTAFGKVICDYICGDIGANELPLPSTAVSQPSFPGLREAVYELGSQAAHLLWTK